MIGRIGVVIPAHNEEALLPACLDAVAVAVAGVDIPVRVVVALDRCSDGSARAVARHRGVRTVSIDAGNVGLARAAGTNEVLRDARRHRLETVWLASTDGDSVVPGDWLRRQIAFARSGWEVVVGTVRVDDWSGHPPHVGRRWATTYQPIDHHPHVHGANFGCTALAYLESGGWRPLATDEDVALLYALRHRRVLRTASIPVTTSARHDPRARGGFGDALRRLAG
jgi:GT2 family glycosyltransferase